MAISEVEIKHMHYLNSLYTEGAAHRAVASKGWENAIKTVRGETWPARRPKYKISAVMNFLGQIVERKAALLTDSRPTILVTSRKSKDDPLCELFQKTIEGILEEHSFEQKVTEFVMFEEYFGSAFFNTCFDSALDYGKGDIDLVTIDPRCFIFDPFVARSWNLKYGEYCCLETVRPTELLCEQHRERRDDIKADISTGTAKPDSLVHKLRQLFQFDKDSPNQKTSVIPRSIVRDWWIRDRTTMRGKTLAFPNWRHTIIAGGVPVEDGANPYLDGDLPFDMMEWGFNVDSAYGQNEVDPLENPQIMFNKLLAGILENANLMGNGIWIGDKDALSKEGWDRLSNEPGRHVQVKQGRTLRREPGVSLPAHTLQTLELLINGLEKLSGITEVTEGRKPGQVTSGVAIECVDFETECLTKRGWKHVYELEAEDQLYCMDEETEKGIWSPILQLNVQEKYEGPMIEIKNKQIDALVTPNHEWLVGSPSGGFREGKFQRVKTMELNTNHYIPSLARLDEKEAYNVCSHHFAEFLGWLVTEGCITHKYAPDRKGNRQAYEYPEVKISQGIKNDENCKKIEKCLSDCRFKYNTKIDNSQGNNIRIWTLSTKDSQVVKDLVRDKYPGYRFLSTTKPSSLQVLYDTMLSGDGTGRDREKVDTISVVYGTSDRELADQFQMLATLIGVSTSMNITPEKEGAKHKKDCYKDIIKVTCKQTGRVSLNNLFSQNEIKITAFNGPIWCPTTVTGNWFMRRNGKVILSRNSLAIMAQTTIRLKARQLEGLIQRIGQKLIPRIVAYYTEDRVFNLVGGTAKGGFQQYVYERQKIREAIEKRGKLFFQDYTFKVIPSSSLAMTKWQKGLVATQLFQMGAIDQEALLEAIEFQGRDSVMDRMNQQKNLVPLDAVMAILQKTPNGQQLIQQVMQGLQATGGGQRKGAPAKLPATLLRGAHQETGLQQPQIGK